MRELSISGNYYDGSDSDVRSAELLIRGSKFSITEANIDNRDIADLEIPYRVSNTPLTIKLPNGGFFETRQNDVIDQYLRPYSKTDSVLSNPHRFESSFKLICACAVFIIAITYFAIKFGIPYGAEKIASKLPDDLIAQLANGAIEQLDEYYFQPSQLSQERKAELRQLFLETLPPNPTQQYKLYFRQSNHIGANALALPDGSIIMTDALEKLAENDLELQSILFHEVGHVELKHSMRMIIESSGVAALMFWLTGDIEAVTEFIALAPVVLLQMKYSRDHEWEADTYALEKMQQHKLDPIHFATIMSKLSKSEDSDHSHESGEHSNDDDHHTQTNKDNIQDSNEANEKNNSNANNKEKTQQETQEETGENKGSILSMGLDYLSTHPDTQKRIERFEKASKLPQSD